MFPLPDALGGRFFFAYVAPVILLDLRPRRFGQTCVGTVTAGVVPLAFHPFSLVPQAPVLRLAARAHVLLLMANGTAAAAAAATQRDLRSRHSPGRGPEGQLLQAVAVRVDVKSAAVAEALGRNGVLCLEEDLEVSNNTGFHKNRMHAWQRTVGKSETS